MATITQHKIPLEVWLGSQSYSGQRICHKLTKTLPAFDKLKQSLGKPLTELIFDYGIPNIISSQQGDNQRDEELEGSNKPLWASPSEQLQQKITLKMPVIRRGKQVLCYQSIQEIGEEVEIEIKKEMEAELNRKMKEIHEQIKAQFDNEIDMIKERTKRDMYELYTIRLKQIFSKMWKKFEHQMFVRENLLQSDAKKTTKLAEDALRKSMEQQLLCAVDELEKNYKLKINFLAEWNRNQLHQEYVEKINIYNNTWTDLVKKAKKSEQIKETAIADNLKSLYQLNLLEVVARERDFANRMMEDTVIYFIQRINDLQSQIKKLFTTLVETNEQLKINKVEIISWECLLKDVVGQFQKFANYVLQAVPGDAEYLLSLEKLLERRNQSFEERLKEVEKVTADIYPLPSWEKLSTPESDASDQVSVVIQSIMEIILYRSLVQVTKKPPHEGILPKKQREEIWESSKSPTTVSSSSVSLIVETELSTTISPLGSSACSCATDRSFADRIICSDVEDGGFDENLYETNNEEMENLSETNNEEMEKNEVELADDFRSEFLDGIIMMDELLSGDNWYLGSKGEIEALDDDALSGLKQWKNLSEIFDEDLDAEFDDYSSVISPAIITEFLQTGLLPTELTTSSLENVNMDSKFMSSTTLVLDQCEDGTIRKTKSMLDMEAARFAKKCTDLKFIGVDLPPTPSVKEEFIQGRILSIMDIMRAHPKLHNVLIEP